MQTLIFNDLYECNMIEQISKLPMFIVIQYEDACMKYKSMQNCIQYPKIHVQNTNQWAMPVCI